MSKPDLIYNKVSFLKIFIFSSFLFISAFFLSLFLPHNDVNAVEILGSIDTVLYEKDAKGYVLDDTAYAGVIYAYKGEILDRDIISPSIERLSLDQYRVYAGLPQFYQLNGQWYQIEYASVDTATFQNMPKEITPVSFINTALATTYFPASDGQFQKSNGTYSTAHDASSADSNDNTSDAVTVTNEKVGATYYIRRVWFTFDTSAIGTGYSVVSGALKFVCDSSQFDSSDSYTLVDFNPTDSSSVVVDDYDLFGTTGDSITSASINCNDSTYNSIPLNSGIFSAINMTGVTSLGLRSASDVSNTTPTAISYFSLRTSKYTGTSKDPYLDLTVSLDATPTPTPIYSISSVSAELHYYSTDLFYGIILYLVSFGFIVFYFNKRFHG